MIYQDPLTYLLGLEGVALLRAFAGEHDATFVRERIAEIRELLDSDLLREPGAVIAPMGTVEGYRAWAPAYDEPGNALVDAEGQLVCDIIDRLPTGVAVDVACGTGRHTRHLVDRGYDAIGVDSSPDMLERARAGVPAARFALGDLQRLPIADSSADVVVCGLALTHIPDLDTAFAELTRVLRPGGHLVVSDAAGLAAGVRPPIIMRDKDGRPGYLPHRNRLTGDYLRAALRLGLLVRACEEPRLPDPYVDPAFRPGVDEMLREDHPNIWWLHHWFPDATNAALRNTPFGVVWHFQRE